MGVHVEGEASADFSRELTAAEFAAWDEACRTYVARGDVCGYRDEDGELCGAPVRYFGDISKGHAVGSEHGSIWTHVAPASSPHPVVLMLRDWSAYDPEGWSFDDSTWGDVGGVTRWGPKGFSYYTSGKVYDAAEAPRVWISLLPPDVKVTGGGHFTSDSEPWGWRVKADGRTVEEATSLTVFSEELLKVGDVVLEADSVTDDRTEALVTVLPGNGLRVALRTRGGAWGPPMLIRIDERKVPE